MMQYGYLVGLVVSILGLIVADWRYKLALFADARRAVTAVISGVIVLLVWDFAGIALDIFHAGNSAFATGWQLAPDLPIEEPVFLTLLCYLSLLTFVVAKRRTHV